MYKYNQLEIVGIKVIFGDYRSASIAWNAGLSLSAWRWIGFWDDGDLPNVKNFTTMV